MEITSMNTTNDNSLSTEGGETSMREATTARRPDNRREVPDKKVGGLRLVVYSSGSESRILRYRRAGAQHKLMLGRPPAIDRAEARKLARQAKTELAKGQDPAATRRISGGRRRDGLDPVWSYWDAVAQEAGKAAAAQFETAVAEIDEKFGKGYAAKNPRLVASFMQTAAISFHAGPTAIASRIRNATVGAGEYDPA
jgi:hypothetical protein